MRRTGPDAQRGDAVGAAPLIPLIPPVPPVPPAPSYQQTTSPSALIDGCGGAAVPR